jgi:hypothetical protein
LLRAGRDGSKRGSPKCGIADNGKTMCIEQDRAR